MSWTQAGQGLLLFFYDTPEVDRCWSDSEDQKMGFGCGQSGTLARLWKSLRISGYMAHIRFLIGAGTAVEPTKAMTTEYQNLLSSIVVTTPGVPSNI